jgi:hypothetical protein
VIGQDIANNAISDFDSVYQVQVKKVNVLLVLTLIAKLVISRQVIVLSVNLVYTCRTAFVYLVLAFVLSVQV